jgi:hypothetical protein
LFEDDVARDDVLFAALFGAESFAGGIAGFGVGAALGCV